MAGCRKQSNNAEFPFISRLGGDTANLVGGESPVILILSVY